MLLGLGGWHLSARDLLAALGQPAALCGLAFGALFALTAIFVKRATLTLDTTDLVLAALTTHVRGLHCPSGARDVASGRGELAAVEPGGTACWSRLCCLWFTSFAVAPVALVRIVRQVEVIFTLVFSRHYLGERTRPYEVVGMGLVAGGAQTEQPIFPTRRDGR